jgi:hypothetical protein
MTAPQLRQELGAEIAKLPDDALENALRLLHAFRLSRADETGIAPATDPADILHFAGSWCDAPELNGLEDELAARRKAAFGTRRNDAAGAD